jgi:hypothetical protein
MTKDEALRMAIDALCRAWDTEEYWKTMTSALQACKEALAQPTAEQSSLVQEPVAWMNDIAFSMDKELLGTRSRIVPLYTTPPSREWQSLSDAELSELFASVGWVEKDNNLKDLGFYNHARAIEQALKEKNYD